MVVWEVRTARLLPIPIGRHGTEIPIGEIAAELVRGLLRLVGQFFVEVIGELFVRSVGYAICRRFTRVIDREGWVVVVVGLLFWVVAFGVGYVVYIHVAGWLDVDACLDSGGSYKYQERTCVYG